MDKPKTRMLRSLTLLYIILPAMLFAWGWLRFPFSLVSILILSIFILLALQDLRREFKAWISTRGVMDLRQMILKDNSPVVFAYILITVWLLMSGAGGFGAQNTDYWASNALFKDLIDRDWPLSVSIDGTSVPIVYYVAYFLPAAAVGKSFGWGSANIFLFLWTWIGVVLSFHWFWRLSGVGKSKLPKILGLVVIFCLAGGLDLIGAYVIRRSAFDITYHIEVWAEYFQYSSQTTLIYWVPQQAIAGWLLIGVIGDCLLRKQDLRFLGIAVSCTVIWSPFSVVGTLPFIFWLLVRYMRTELRDLALNPLSLSLNLSSLWIGGIHSLYILSNQYRFPFGLIFNLVEDGSRLYFNLVAFWILEFLLLALLVLTLVSRSGSLFRLVGQVGRVTPVNHSGDHLGESSGITSGQLSLFGISCISLFLLPLVKAGYKNDFVMRVSIPSLFIFWSFVGKAVLDQRPIMLKKLRLISVPLIIVLSLSLFPAVSEISRSISNYHIGPPAVSEVPEFTDLSDYVVEQRLGSQESFFFTYMARSLGE